MSDEKQIQKRNYFAFLMEGVLFNTALAFIDVNAVIPVFIYTYTHSLRLAGLATTINLAAAIITQTLIGPFVKRIRNLPAYMVRVMIFYRPLLILMLPILFTSLDSAAIVWIFLAIYALQFACDGLVVVPFTDMFARTIMPDRRGKLLGYMQLFGGIGGLVAGFVIKFVLESASMSNPVRYSIIFGCSALAMILSGSAMMLLRDLPHPVADRSDGYWSFFAQFPACFRKNREFSKVTVIRILSRVASMIAPFLILYGKGLFDLDDTQVSTLIYIQIIGGLLGGLLLGNISSRHGNKYAILASQAIGLLIPAYALVCSFFGAGAFPWYLLWPLVLANGMNMGNWFVTLSYTMDVTEGEDRTAYLLLINLITLPLTFLPFLVGIVEEYTGFVPLFIICILAAILGIVLSRRLKSPAQLAIPGALEED